MYNFYTYEKRKKEKEHKEKNEIKEKQLKAHQEKILPELTSNYEDRIKNFIYEMAISKNPIIVKDCTKKIESTRYELLQEEDSKIKARRGIVIRGFKTEKERINDYLKNNIYLNLQNDSKSHKSEKKFVQPQMRFKARTDLERIFDTINQYSYGKVSKEIINKQLKSLDLNVPEIIEKSDEEEEEEEHEMENKKRDKNEQLEKLRSLLFQKLDKKSKKRKFVDNSEAKELMKEYHIKTHFKGATDISLFNKVSSLSPGSSRNIKNYSSNDKQILLEKELSGSNDTTIYPKFSNNIIKRNPFKTKKNELNESDPSLDPLYILKKMSYNSSSTNDDFSTKSVKFSLPPLTMLENYNTVQVNKTEPEDIKKRDDERIIIDNESFLRSDVNLITKKVLQKCNFFHNKNKNNNTSLKKSEGKQMFTGGMSIAEFSQKYHF